MYFSFNKFISEIPGVVYQGFYGLAEIVEKDNLKEDGSVIVPAEFYDKNIYKNLLESMIEFRDKPNGIVGYLLKTNNVDTTFSVSVFDKVEDFIIIAQSSWFEDYQKRRADYLRLIRVTPLQKILQSSFLAGMPLSLETTYEELDYAWENTESTIE